MNKAFNPFTWFNEPNHTTPLSAENLNKINTAVDTIDDRVITLDTEKSEVSVSETGTATDSVKYITVDGVEKKLGGDGVFISDTEPTDLDVKSWIDTSTGMIVDAGYVFSNVWDISLPTSGWTQSSGKYVQTVSALGYDHHFVCLAWIDSPTDSQAEAYALIEEVKSDADDTITVVCSSLPSVAFSIKVKYHESTEQKHFDDFALKTELPWDLLWTNASPSSAFSAQTINLDLSGYKFILVKCNYSTTDSNNSQHNICKLEECVTMTAFSMDMYLCGRRCKPSNNSVYFTDAYGGDHTIVNSACIPYKIYGIR